MGFVRLMFAVLLVLALPARAAAPQSFADRLLAAHNDERTAHGIAPLAWSPVLAQQAAVWAESLAARGLFQHAADRQGAGENLWTGTAGYFSPEAMIEVFLVEGDKFHPGKFPDVSATGKWSDVGHYSQLIWPGTRALGCALASGHGRDVLVCRYFPAGNVMGERIP